ncbi:hypothetical protein COHA_004102 [Chlorella ohadii]|uniref:Uncharacterized protein n=1 Tax=Chlorella ohadii TaxID=2649997 RepID=A0AAD5DXN1_9CHLO|nr:hypothetical protein COHA_004102 [Chlorella ohadii]
MSAARLALLAVLAAALIGGASACGCSDESCCNWWTRGHRVCYRTYSIWRYGPQRFINATAQFELMRLVPAINAIYAEEMGVKGCTMTKYSALSGCSQERQRYEHQFDTIYKWTDWSFTYDTAWWCPVGAGSPQCKCASQCLVCQQQYENGLCPCRTGHFEYITIKATMQVWQSGRMQEINLKDYWDAGEW